MLLANFVNLAVGLLGSGLYSHIVKAPQYVSYSIIGLTCMTGVFASTNSLFSLYIMIIFAVIGYLMKKFDYSFVAFLIGFVLAPEFEVSFRSFFLVAQGYPIGFLIQRPIAMLFCVITVLSVVRIVWTEHQKLAAQEPSTSASHAKYSSISEKVMNVQPKIRGGAILARALKEKGVEHVFTLAGGFCNPALEVFMECQMPVINCPHEQVAGHLADGHTRITRKPSVCLVGPEGFANAVPAMLEAWGERTPVIFVTGSSTLKRQGAG